MRLGSTTVITGVKSEVSEGSLLDDSSKGFVVSNVHFAAGAHAKVRPGPPSEQVQSLTFRVNECISRLGLLDPAKLFIQEGLVWALYIDIVVLNDEGSLWDAIWYSIMAALRDTLLPEIAIDASAGLVTITEEAKTPLQLECDPLPISALYYPEKDFSLLHPTSSETALSSTRPVELLFDRTTLKVLYQETSSSSQNIPLSQYKKTVLDLLQ